MDHAIPVVSSSEFSLARNVATREQWLTAAVHLLRPAFVSHGSPLPTTLRVSCGFPSQGGLASRTIRLGECWSADVSADGHHEIFVSPLLDDTTEVLGVLAHECCHAALPKNVGHNAPFKRLGQAIGLDGPPKSMGAGKRFKEEVAPPIIAALGPYPHARLMPLEKVQKQTTRLIKCECPHCGYVTRTARKWLDIGAPLCPTHGTPMVHENALVLAEAA